MKCIFVTAFQRFINYFTFFKNALQRRAQARTPQAAYRPYSAVQGRNTTKAFNIIAEYIGLLMINIRRKCRQFEELHVLCRATPANPTNS